MTHDLRIVNNLEDFMKRVQNDEVNQTITLWPANAYVGDKAVAMLVYFGEPDEKFLEAIDAIKRTAIRKLGQ